MRKEKFDIECPFCGEKNNVYLISKKMEVEIKNQKVEFDSKCYICESCDEEFVDGEMANANLNLARDEYRIQNNLLTSKEIADIRKKYSLSQADFSLALGWGEITITRYESKLIQDSTYDTILKMIRKNPLIMLEILQSNKCNFTEEKYEKIETKVKNVIEKEIKEPEINKLKDTYAIYNKPSAENGYTILDIETLNNIIGTILSKTNCMHKVELMKTLWYIDQIYFEKTGRSVTGLVYLHYDFGALPVCNNELLSLPAITSEVEYYSNGNVGYKMTASKKFKPVKISKQLEEIIEMVINKFKDSTAKEIVAYMHKEKAYLNTVKGEIMRFDEKYKLNEF